MAVHQKTYTGSNYRAHITHQKGRCRGVGDIIDVGSFTLVKQVREKGTRTMIKRLDKEFNLR
jgi:hypothetical protein